MFNHSIRAFCYPWFTATSYWTERCEAATRIGHVNKYFRVKKGSLSGVSSWFFDQRLDWSTNQHSLTFHFHVLRPVKHGQSPRGGLLGRDFPASKHFFWKTTNLLYSCPGNNHFGDMNWGRLRNKLALTQSDGGAKFYEIGWTHISEKLGQLKKLETPVCFTSWQEGRNGAVFLRTHKFPTCGEYLLACLV